MLQSGLKVYKKTAVFATVFFLKYVLVENTVKIFIAKCLIEISISLAFISIHIDCRNFIVAVFECRQQK